jgi:ELMO domain-containing protein
MFDNIIHAIYLFTRSIIKWFLHKYTRLCELQRIVYGSRAGSPRAKLVENSLALSKQPEIKNMIAIFDKLVETSFMIEIDYKHDVTDVAVNTVLSVKRINPKIHHRFPQNFGNTIDKIWGYKRLNYLVEDLRRTPYDCSNLEHESKLLELWRLLMPDVELENRISKQWQDIGFQVSLI